MSSSKPARTAAQRRMFLEHYAVVGTVEGACELAGIDSKRHRTWLATSELYRQQFQQAFDKATDTLLAEARRRAMGFEEDVYYQGHHCGTVRKYSDLLLMFLLKGARPQTFRDFYREVNISGSVDNRVTVNVVHEFRDSPTPQLQPPALPPQLPGPTIDVEPSD